MASTTATRAANSAASTRNMPGYSWKHMPIASAVSYSVISIAITLINKAVLTSYHFESSMTLTLLQGLFTVICLESMRRMGYIDYHPWSWSLVWKVAPLSFVFIAYVIVSLVSLGRVNVPMFTALRRLTIVFVMVEEFFFLGVTPSRKVVLTVLLMIVGAAIAAWKDLTYDPVSYGYLFLTNLFTSLYTVFINKVRADTGLNLFAMMYYNNITTMPALLVLAWWTEDLQAALAFKNYRSFLFEICFQSSIYLAFVLNLSTFYCTSLNSARTQTVVGQLKNFFAFLLGLVLFDDYIYDPINFIGLWVGFGASVWYAWVAYEEKAKPMLPSVKNEDEVPTGIGAALSPLKPSISKALTDEEGGGGESLSSNEASSPTLLRERAVR